MSMERTGKEGRIQRVVVKRFNTNWDARRFKWLSIEGD